MKNLVLSLIFFSCVTYSQDIFYVANGGNNANDGSSSFPWRNIQFGIDQLNAGDKLIITTGSYSETVIFQGANDSGVLNNPVTLQAENGVIIDGTGITPVGRQGLITIRDASHIIVDGFELAHFKTANGLEINDSPVGILIEGSSTHITIKNNVIHDIQNRSSCGQSTGCGTGANGIGVYGDKVVGISDLEFNNNEIHHCVLAASEAFTINGNVDRFKVINNYIHDNNNIGLVIIGYENDVCAACTEENNRARNGYVKGNRAINNSIKLSVGGFVTNPWYENDDGNAGGFYVDGGRNIIFDGNFSSQNDIGFEFASEHAGKSSADILMINNFIYNNREVGISLGGYAQSTAGEGGGNATRINIFNNSFYHNQGWGTEISFAFRVIDFIAANNIFFGTGDVNDNFSDEVNGQHQNTNWLNNIWWALDNTDTSLLPETSPMVTNPQFISPATGDLRVASGSQAIDNGLVQNDISTWSSPLWPQIFATNNIPAHGSTDINGELRIENNVIDIGADEFGTFVDIIYQNGFE